MAAQVIMAAQAMTRKAKPDQDEDARKGSEWNSRTRAHTHFLSQKPMSSFCYVSSMCSDVHESQEPLQKDWFLTSQLLYSQTNRWSHICKRVNRNSKVFRDNMLSLRCVGSLLCFFYFCSLQKGVLMRRGLMTRLRNQAKQRTQMSKRSEPKRDPRNVGDGDVTQAVSTSVCIHACVNIFTLRVRLS